MATDTMTTPQNDGFEAIVLAGGLGTRLRKVVSDVPKPLAPISGRPFLDYLLTALRQKGAHHVVLSVGYLHEQIEARYGARWGELDISYAVEETPLGTGGALAYAARSLKGSKLVLGLNGDTVLAEDFDRLISACQAAKTRFGLFVRPVDNSGRYSTCVVKNGQLTGFQPGVEGQPGLINAGVYAISPSLLHDIELQSPFSFEQDFLPKALMAEPMSAVETRAPFIDIGVPDSFELAQEFIPNVLSSG